MKTTTWEQLQTMIGGMGRALRKNNADALAAANKAQETADKAQKNKMDATNPTGKGYFLMNPIDFNDPGDDSHTEGSGSAAKGFASHAEGTICYAYEHSSHAEGYESSAHGKYSHAEGQGSGAEGLAAHAEGISSVARGYASHAEGEDTHANHTGSHAEGSGTLADANYAHAEGSSTKAYGSGSHAEGFNATARGDYSHAEGDYTEAVGDYTHAEGVHTVASGEASHAQGKYNSIDKDSKYAHIVGNGESLFNRSNAHTLDWDGNAWFAGDVYVGGSSQDDGEKLVTESELAAAMVLTSPSGTRYKLTVTDDGTLAAVQVTEE